MAGVSWSDAGQVSWCRPSRFDRGDVRETHTHTHTIQVQASLTSGRSLLAHGCSLDMHAHTVLWLLFDLGLGGRGPLVGRELAGWQWTSEWARRPV